MWLWGFFSWFTTGRSWQKIWWHVYSGCYIGKQLFTKISVTHHTNVSDWQHHQLPPRLLSLCSSRINIWCTSQLASIQVLERIPAENPKPLWTITAQKTIHKLKPLWNVSATHFRFWCDWTEIKQRAKFNKTDVSSQTVKLFYDENQFTVVRSHILVHLCQYEFMP